MVVEIKSNGIYVDASFFYPVGVNYWPRDTAVYQWKEYDRAAIEHEFKLMASLGINCIRCFIMWDDLLKAKDVIDESFFAKFEHFHDTASQYGIKLVPTLFIGHMSGQDWFPSWFLLSDDDARNGVPYQEIGLPPRKTTKGKVRDIYLDEDINRNAFLQLETLLPRYKDSTTILSWDLSNENQYMMRPKLPEHGFAYIKRMYEKIKDLDPNHPVTLGMGKFSENSGFHSYGEWSIAKYNEYYCVHSYLRWYYPITLRYIDFYATYKPIFDMRISMVSGIPVQQQEFGLQDGAFMGKRKSSKNTLLAGYYRAVLWGGLLNGVRCGSMGWCFADFSKPLANRDPYVHKKHELHFGVFDASYRPKGSAIALQEFSAFIKRINVENFVEEPSRVAIILPWNYLEKKDMGASLAALMDDDPTKNDKKRHFLVDCWMNQNRAMFSAFIFCRMAGVQPDFLPPGAPLDEYKLVMLPDLKGFTSDGREWLNNFVDNGGYVYISSNGYLPDQWDAVHGTSEGKKTATRIDLVLKEVPEVDQEINKAFAPVVGLSLAGVRSRAAKVRQEFTLYVDKASGEAIVTFIPSATLGKGGFVVMKTAPEINHAAIRNDYKTDGMPSFYSALFTLADIDMPLSNSNRIVEVGRLVNQQSGERLVIAINHDLEPQHVQIGLRLPSTSVKACQDTAFKSCGSEISFKLEGYGCSAFLVR